MTDRQAGKVGIIEYNGFRFPASAQVQVQSKPIYDDSKRVVKYVELQIHIECTITSEDQLFPVGSSGTASQPIGNNFEALRLRLQKSRGRLIITDQGFGDINVNTSNGLNDVNYGPKPSLVSWQTIGSNRAARLIWECTTQIPECGTSAGKAANSSLNNAPITQFNYSMTWDIGTNGITSRSIVGNIEIPLNTISGRIEKTADELRELANFIVPQGFKRTQNWPLSQDRRTLEFTLTDSEIQTDNPYPRGIVNRDVTHRISANVGLGFKNWNNTISGTIEVAPGQPKSLAWEAFLQIIKQFTDKQGDGNFTDGTDYRNKEIAKKKSTIQMFTSIDITDNLDGRDISFSISYLLLCDLKSIFKATGMFQPLKIPNQSWANWRTSMGLVQGVRGTAGLEYLASSDLIVSVCDSAEPVIQDEGTLGPTEAETDIFDCKKPPKNASWIDYDPEFEVVELHNVVIQQPLQEVSVPSGSTTPSSEEVLNASGNIDSSISRQEAVISESVNFEGRRFPNPAETNIQVRGPAQYLLIFTGFAIRVGYPIPKPTITKIGGITAIKVGKDSFTHKELKSVGTKCKTYSAKWRSTYILPKPPSEDVMRRLETQNHPGNFNQ